MPKINETINSPNQSSRGGKYPELIVLHICDGYYQGTKAWFAQAASATSSHFIVARDGRICQCVPLDKMAWCNGTNAVMSDLKYYGHSTVDLVRTLGGNANQYSVSIECEGFWSETQGALTEAQLESVAWLCGHIRDEVKRLYNRTILMDRRHIVGHNEITPKTRSHCPGEKFPWAALIAKLEGKSVSALYRVQVGAYGVKANAERFLKETVLPKGIEAFIVQGKDEKGNTLYRVQVGAFGVRSNAEGYLTTVKGRGLEAFLVLAEV